MAQVFVPSCLCIVSARVIISTGSSTSSFLQTRAVLLICVWAVLGGSGRSGAVLRWGLGKSWVLGWGR